MSMDKPCCKGIERSPDHLKGTITTVDGIQHYFTEPEADQKNNIGVVVTYDIFGFIPNTKYIVDHLATRGFTATMPDFYDGFPWEMAKGFDQDFMTWFGSITSPEYWAKVTGYCKKASDFLKSKGCTKIVMMGFCWGGLATGILAKTDIFSACVSLHGCHDGDALKDVKTPLLFITVNGDPYFKEEAHAQLLAEFKKGDLKGGLKVYEGVEHGFVNRPDLTKPGGKEKSDQAMEDAMAFFLQYAK